MTALLISNTNDLVLASLNVSEIADSETVNSISSGLKAAISQPGLKKLLIDFSKVKFFNSEMVGQFAFLNKKCAGACVRLKMSGLSDNLLKVFRLVRLDTVFELYPTQADALKAYQWEDASNTPTTEVTDLAEKHIPAAESGDPKAQYRLGVCYENGWGIEQDFKRAFLFYEMAAKLKHCEALFSLAHCYAYGMGVKKDYDRAIQAYRQAADMGHVAAQYIMGMSYDFGIGVEADSGLARQWYRKAAAQGDIRATEALEQLES